VSDQTEELILEIERAYLPLPALAARLAAVEQSLMMFWTSLGFGSASNGVSILLCCATVYPGDSIDFVDSVWGAGTLVWNPAGNSSLTGNSDGLYECWLTGLAWPGVGACGAATIAIYYAFDPMSFAIYGTYFLYVQWLTSTASGCPIASTGAFVTPGAGEAYAALQYASSTDCTATPVTIAYTMGATTPETKLYTGKGGETMILSFGLAGPDTTSDFPTVCPCLPTSIPLTDSVYGVIDLIYFTTPGSQFYWTACRTVSFPGTTNCAAGTIAITYLLQGDTSMSTWLLYVTWPEHAVSGHTCPLPSSTCTTATTASRDESATIQCSGTTTWTFGAASNSPWPSTGAATCSITL